jgi:hypothetical protein
MLLRRADDRDKIELILLIFSSDAEFAIRLECKPRQ